MMRNYILAGALLYIVAAAGIGYSIDFGVDRDDGQSLIRVTTKNNLMTMEHWTSEITGKVSVDLLDVRATAAATFTIPVASLSSHQDIWQMRDNLMHREYLESDRYPTATFALDLVDKLNPGVFTNFEPLEMTATGNFTLHGITKPVQVQATLIYMEEGPRTQARGAGSLMNITARWTFKLSDFGIKLPRKGPIPFEDEQQVYLHVVGSTVKTGR